MVTTNKFGNVENVVIAEFGNGTIAIVNGTNKTHKSLLIREKEFVPIGEKREFKASSDEFEPQIALVFKNKESFDVFFEFVQNIKNEFQDEEFQKF